LAAIETVMLYWRISDWYRLSGDSYESGELVLQLIAPGTHENCYRDIKR